MIKQPARYRDGKFKLIHAPHQIGIYSYFDDAVTIADVLKPYFFDLCNTMHPSKPVLAVRDRIEVEAKDGAATLRVMSVDPITHAQIIVRPMYPPLMFADAEEGAPVAPWDDAGAGYAPLDGAGTNVDMSERKKPGPRPKAA